MVMAGAEGKLTIAVIFGGRSGEHEVSLMSARSVLSVLDRNRYDVIEIGITHQGTWVTGKNVLEALETGTTEGLSLVFVSPDPSKKGIFIIDTKGSEEKLKKLGDVDVYFPVLHGTFGEDGTLQGLFELADVAYVGAGVLGSAVGMDKGLFKDVMRSNDIPVIESVIILRAEIESSMETVIEKAEKIGAYPLFVKPANLGSSVGITKCRSRSDLAEGLMDAAQFDRRVLIERGVPNPREIEVSVLGNQKPTASIPGEIVPGADFYSYDAKYVLDNSELIIPAQLTAEQVNTFRELAVKAYEAVDAAGMARVDFLMEKETGKIYLNEINTIPGFTKISMYPKLWEASGLPYASLVDRLIEFALNRKAERDSTVRQYRRTA
jgi:D-alanine-D-alanine ligase